MVVLVPLVTSTAHNLRFQFSSSSTKHHYRRHSRAWWRRHRAMLRRRQAMAARRRALNAMARTGVPTAKSGNHAGAPALATTGRPSSDTLFAPLPEGWSRASATNDSSSFRIGGMPESHASLAVVAPARANNDAIGRELRNSLGGVSYSDLRRNVIDKMISAGGWVVNDRQRDINGHRVFQVIAQTPATNDGKPEQVWNFYFTEANGRIYSLTTHTGGSTNEKLAADSEKFISNIRPAESSRINK